MLLLQTRSEPGSCPTSSSNANRDTNASANAHDANVCDGCSADRANHSNDHVGAPNGPDDLTSDRRNDRRVCRVDLGVGRAGRPGWAFPADCQNPDESHSLAPSLAVAFPHRADSRFRGGLRFQDDLRFPADFRFLDGLRFPGGLMAIVRDESRFRSKADFQFPAEFQYSADLTATALVGFHRRSKAVRRFPASRTVASPAVAESRAGRQFRLMVDCLIRLTGGFPNQPMGGSLAVSWTAGSPKVSTDG